MNDKITIQELAAYLPWEVEAIHLHRDITVKILGLQLDLDIIHNHGKTPIEFIKPILYPLSSLTKPKNGIDSITWFDDICWNLFDSRTPDNYECSKIVLNELLQAGKVQMDTYYVLVEYLLKNHFDLFDLIKRGKAIDKTTIQ